MDSLSAGVPTSPPASTTSPPQNMTPGPPHPFAIAPAGRTSGLSASLPHLGLHSPSGYSNSSYNHTYTTSATSPSTTSGSLQEAQANDVSSLSASGISPTQISSSSLNAQKRAYRQRRKDPSCDACRERKVKCDATETTACSECSSRNHKCQFTKETNRRMSSIKQVQDLQSRIAELTEENTHLRTRISDRTSAERGPVLNQRQDGHAMSPSIPSIPQRVPIPVMKNFEHVRRNVQHSSRGIFEFPPHYQLGHAFLKGNPSFPEIPPRQDFAHLSRFYLDSIHTYFPILHWPTFQQDVDQVYTARSFQGRSREWIGLFFAVMACGALHAANTATALQKTPYRGFIYYEAATEAMAHLPEDVTIAHAALAFLLCLYTTESNMKSAGAMWLASSVRFGQCLRLYSEVDAPILEREMRRRLWWSIYSWDRISSLITNLPLMINEDECDIALPSSLEDRYIQHRGFARQPADQPPYTGFLAMIQAARLFPHLHHLLKSVVISPQSIQHMEDRFHSTWKLLPESYQLQSEAPLDTTALSPLFVLQTGRFLLFRRNLSPVCRPPERTEALRRCTLVAQDTAKYISRTLHTSAGMSDPEGWRMKATQLASNMACLHLWRCMLMLCFCGDYEAALMCLHLSSAIGHVRKINASCGKNLTFFLGRMLDRTRSGNGARHQLEYDEEMLVYVSGDMQGNGDHSWVWAGSELSQSSPLSPLSHAPHGFEESMQGIKTNTNNLSLRPISGSPEDTARDWDGWAGIERMIHQLMDEQRARLAQPSPYYPPPHNPLKRVQLAPDTPASPTRSGTAPPPSTSSASRISIANII